MRRNGFTLIEVLAASMIGAFIALVAVCSLRAVSASSEMIDNNIDMASEVKFAARAIAADLTNLYRDRDPKYRELIGTYEVTGGSGASHVSFYTVSRAKARRYQPEGDVYEVEYYVVIDETKSSLMRRLCPNPAKESEAGGILSVIAEDIGVFQVRFFDGQTWTLEWPEQMTSLPELVEVIITSRSGAKARAVSEAFMVNFSKSVGSRSDAIGSLLEQKKDNDVE